MTLVLFLLGAIGFIMANIFTTAKSMRESVTMIVELKHNITEEQNLCIASTIDANEMVSSIRFMSKDEKINDEDFKRAFAVKIDGILDENPLPDSYDVTLSAQAADKEGLKAFADEIRKMKGVSYVSYPQDFVEELHSTLDVMHIIMVMFGSVLLLISFMLLNNTIRLAVYAQRDLINTLKAVGATKWFIMKPFIGRGALQGFIAGILASLLLMGALYGFEYAVPGINIFPEWIEIAYITGAMVAVGVVVAVVCTLPVVSRFVNMKSNTIHLC
jgi:cell division transport system permease protein